ncbi:MAG: hypothetical protein A2033_07795 [Bacteroidetes bacterium GWA2_31_9]|nr:MAG: hypothetical protein A2033_07795 [Bacteroidetes bacterium GWA2_31_9]
MNSSPYIDLLKKVLIDYHRINQFEYRPIDRYNKNWKFKILRFIDSFFRKKNHILCSIVRFNEEDRLNGKDWPMYADSMIGMRRLDNIEYCFRKVIENNITGDFIETGVWRGGATIFMRALLKDSNITNKIVWVADSFEGLPKPNEKEYPSDKGDVHHTKDELAISIETVKGNFAKYNLLDENVKFLKGWFKDTLPKAPIEKLAILRLDGDMYESTMDTLVSLYPKLSKGGYVIIDDWGAVKGCKQATLDYRQKNNITEEIITIDWSSVYWKKE